jgi:membrane protease YdiL (CAAX protease family)
LWILGWLAYPALSQGLPAVEAGLLRIKLMTIGLVWEFVLSMIVLYIEEGNLPLTTIRRRFWLRNPLSARTGEKDNRLWWWLIPFVLLVAIAEMAIFPWLSDLWTGVFPILAEPAGYSFTSIFAPELQAQWVGAWNLLGLFFVMALFNTFLGEEFLFRGVQLPKMQGVFGR